MKLRIEEMVYGGAGLAYAAEPQVRGHATLVPFTLPGEIVDAEPTGSMSATPEASLLQVLTPSPERVEPGCAHFGACGGCHYQHASYSAQIQIKSAILRDTLEHAGLIGLPDIEVHPSDPWEYRNRSRLRLGSVDGNLRVGYNRRASNKFLPIHECPISAPLIWRACEALLHIAQERSPAGRWLISAAEVEFFVSSQKHEEEQRLQMLLLVTRQQPGFNEFCSRMQKIIPQLIGAGTTLLPSAARQRGPQRNRPLQEWGAAGLNYRVAGQDYWITRGKFFQVNRFLLDQLVAIVTTGRRGLIAWDLYAGAGLFSRVLARSFDQVVAVETAAADLMRTFQGPGQRAVEQTTLNFLRGAVLQRERPTLVVLDPPRAGAGDEVCALLARIAAPEITYVSCDPVTLARDLNRLTAAGYRIVELHVVDLFPQTFHLETVVVLRK